METKELMTTGQGASETSDSCSDVVATITLTPKVDRSSFDELSRRVHDVALHLDAAAKLLEGIEDCEVTVQVLLSKG